MRPPIVMIHGMWGSGKVWSHMAAYFRERGWEVHTPSLPFHGLPGERKTLGSLSLRDYTDFLVSYVNQLDQPPVLIGHSMGGLLAQMTAARTEVASLVLFNSAAPAGIQCIRPVMLPGVWRFFCRPAFWKRAFKLSRWEANYCLFNQVPKENRAALYKNVVHESGRAGFELALWFLDPRRTSRINTNKIQCPVLFFAGKKDRITPVSVCRKVAALYDNGALEYHELEGNGHWLLFEPGWEKAAGRIDHWLHDKLNIPEDVPALVHSA